MEKEQDFKKPEYYENRELSWLKFNHRVHSASGTIKVCQYHFVKSGRIFHGACRIPEGYGTRQL